MKTTGQTLQEARIAKKLELDDVAKNTKIRVQFLSWLEADDFGKLPNATVAKGFIRNYCLFLGLNPNQVLAVFRRDFIENEQGQIIPRGMVDPVSKTSLWTPKSTIIAAVVFIFVLFFGYLGYQFWLLKGPPSLELISPPPSYITSDSTVEISGKTDPEATITVNGQLVSLDKGGQFFVRLPLNSPQNLITIISTGKSGKTTIIKRTVVLTTPPPNQ